jgi:hypothetical protein
MNKLKVINKKEEGEINWFSWLKENSGLSIESLEIKFYERIEELNKVRGEKDLYEANQTKLLWINLRARRNKEKYPFKEILSIYKKTRNSLNKIIKYSEDKRTNKNKEDYELSRLINHIQYELAESKKSEEYVILDINKFNIIRQRVKTIRLDITKN